MKMTNDCDKIDYYSKAKRVGGQGHAKQHQGIRFKWRI